MITSLTKFPNLSGLRPLLKGNTVVHSVSPERRTYSTKEQPILSLWNQRTVTLPTIKNKDLSREIIKAESANPLIKKLLNGHNFAYAILKGLMEFSPQIDPLVSNEFYCRELEKLGIYGSDIETLFEVCGKDLIGFMSILRARQLGLIEESFIYSVIKIKQPINIHLPLIIKEVQKELYRLLDIETLKDLCGNDLHTFNAALRAQLAGMDKEGVYNAVQLGQFQKKDQE